MEDSSRSCATRAFQLCRISCQGRDQSVAAGGPNALRSSFRNVNFVEIFPSNRRMTCRFVVNARKAAWRWKSMYASWQPPAWSKHPEKKKTKKHPNHLCVQTRSRTSTVTPPRVCHCCKTQIAEWKLQNCIPLCCMTGCDPFVSHSANRAFVCHAHASLTRGFEMRRNVWRGSTCLFWPQTGDAEEGMKRKKGKQKLLFLAPHS